MKKIDENREWETVAKVKKIKVEAERQIEVGLLEKREYLFK